MERREAHRYPLSAPVRFSWEDATSNQTEGSGMTRDVSVNGAFIIALTWPPAETIVQLTIFPVRMQGAEPTVQIKGQARVIRVDRGDDVAPGFAVVSESFNLHSRGKPVVEP
jgi:hypothetical protein